MEKRKFYFKKDISDLTDFIEVSETVVYLPEEGRFGKSVPNIKEFFKFLNIPYFTTGFSNYNGLNLSTQVPAREILLVKEDLKIVYEYWKIVHSTKVAEDLTLFDKFNLPEYMIYDCLINFDIIDDGYFKNKHSLIKGIFKKANEIQTTHDLDLDKVISEALKIKPELLKYGVTNGN